MAATVRTNDSIETLASLGTGQQGETEAVVKILEYLKPLHRVVASVGDAPRHLEDSVLETITSTD
jgi:hypothetical protein